MAFRTLLNLFVAASLICTSHAITCATNCACSQEEQKIKVKCSNVPSFPKFTDISTNITSLNLKGNNLSTIAADNLAELPNLEYLFLDANKITSIQNGTFSRNPELKKICLDQNSLEEVSPGVFFNLESLDTIYLKKNKISRLRSYAFYNMTSLHHIDMTGNGLKSIEAEAFYGVENLRRLTLTDNLLTSVPSETFKLIPNLKYLYIENNRISKLMNQTFSMLKNLTRLYLSHNKLSYIGDYVFKDVPIQYLWMIDCGLAEIPSVLDSLYDITDLDISLNNFSVIPSAVFFNLEKLVFLRISHIQGLTDVHADAFIGLDSLTSVHMTDCPNLKELPEKAFWKNQRLWSLDLRGNGLKSLPEYLAQWDKLRFVDVTDNNFTCDCGVEWIQKRIKRKDAWPSKQIENDMYHLNCTDKLGLEKIRNFDFKTLRCEQHTTSAPAKRILTGLVAAIIAVVVVLVVCLACGFRKKIMNKYRQFKYSRHKDEAPYTIAKYSDLDATETRVTPNHVDVFRDEKDDEELI
nr:leucine-rich repeat-containing protein [Pinctada fucata]